MKGIVFPIHKAGDGRIPDNYRGISLLNIVSKIYEGVLYNRLNKWCERKGNILEEQGGFIAGRCCVD